MYTGKRSGKANLETVLRKILQHRRIILGRWQQNVDNTILCIVEILGDEWIRVLA